MLNFDGASDGGLPQRRRKRDAVRDFFTPAKLLALIWTAIIVFMFSSLVRFSRVRGAKGLAESISRFLSTGKLSSLRAPTPKKMSRKLREFKRLERLYKDTAIITLATGDAAAKHAVALIQALRDSYTMIPRIIVLLSRGGIGSEDCHNDTLRNMRGRHYPCASNFVQADDIVSNKYLDAFGRLAAEVLIIDQIPNTMYTTMIPGGRASFWGMSFNKLRIFAMTEFKKILFLDADIMIYDNIDWIMNEPDFTAAFTTECCNGGARGKLGGGIWVFEPSEARWNYTNALINMPCPDSELGTWVHADMDVVNYMFCDIREGESFESWPFTRDLRQGVLPGLKYIKQYRDISEGDYNSLVSFPTSGLPAPEGLLPMHANKRGIWHILDSRFDSLVGNCECMGHRDMYDMALSVHFSCSESRVSRGDVNWQRKLTATPPQHNPPPNYLVSRLSTVQVFSKPGHFRTDWDLMNAVYTRGKSCSRYYYMNWYDHYKKAMGPFPPPYWDGPPVPIWNETHDALVDKWKQEREERERQEELRLELLQPKKK